MTAATEPVSYERLWHDGHPFEAQRERSVNALVALRDTLAARRPLDGREDAFLSLYGLAREIDAGVFTTTWSCPAAYAWTRRTFERTQACLAAPGDRRPAERLRAQLAAFSLFALALGRAAGVEVRLPAPIRLALPVNLPGTAGVIDGNGVLELTGREAIELVERPTVRFEGTEIALLPEALAVPGAEWPDAALALEAGPAFQAGQAGALADALALVQRHAPKTFAQIRDRIRVVALLPRDARPYPNASSSEHPGAMLLGAQTASIELAEHVVHEHYHNRLFALESTSAMLEPETDPAHAERFYSPWRDEPRTMRGLFHGTYVFAPVLAFWLSAQDDHPAAADRAGRIALQLRIAVGQVERHARLTAYGDAVFAALRDRIDTLAAATAPSAAIRSAVREHASRYDRDGQVELP